MAQRPEELVELLPEAERFLAREAAVGEPAERPGLVLVHDLAGDFDAAHAGALAGAHLLAGLPHEVIARFDADSLVDYRAHRPRMTFNSDHYESFAAPEILLYALEDDAGVPFLLLHGAEPDYAWERFVAAVGTARRAARGDLRGGPAGHPDAGPPHPAGHRHRPRDAARPDRLLSRVLGRDAHPRQHLGAAGAAPRRGRGRRPRRRRARAALPGPGHLPGGVGHAPGAPRAADRPAPAHRGAARGGGGQPDRDRRADRPLGRQHRRRRRPGAAVRHFAAAREGTGLLGAAGEVPSAEEIGAEFERFLADQDRKRPRD